jgi:hypothetical protein
MYQSKDANNNNSSNNKTALWAYTHPHQVIVRSKTVRYLEGTGLSVSMEC